MYQTLTRSESDAQAVRPKRQATILDDDSVELQRFSMTRNEGGYLSAAKRLKGKAHDRTALAGLA